MKFPQHQIVQNPRRSDQVGLQLKCVSELQAKEVYRAVEKHFRIGSKLLSPQFPTWYTHFIYINTTEEKLREKWQFIESSYNEGSGTKVEADYAAWQANAAQKFKAWQLAFRKVLQNLNTTSSVVVGTEGIDSTSIERLVSSGQAVNLEERLLNARTLNNSNTLRALISLYVRTEKPEQIVELCVTRRNEVLALPVSGRLVEQIVSAHLQQAQQTEEPELLYSAQQIAQEFLPELERIRQADGVRRLLHQALKPQEPLESVTTATLSEQLAQLVEVEPGERILQLEALKSRHPSSISVLFDLAAAYATTGDQDKALEIYQSIPAETEQDQNIVRVRQAELLLANNRFKEIIDLLPDSIDTLSPALAGLRGAALYAIEHKAQARPFLEKAWQAGERQFEILLSLARLWATEGDPIDAAEIYLILLETTPEYLTVEDRVNIATIAISEGFGKISDMQEVNYYEQLIENAGSRITSLPNAEEILKERLKLWQRLNQLDKLLIAYADWLDWLASHKKLDDLDAELNHLHTIATTQKIDRYQHFELLEGLEPYITLLPCLRQRLIDEYQGIAIEEIENAIQHHRSEDVFLKDLKRSLQYLSPEVANQIFEHQQQRQSEATNLGIQVSPPSIIQEPQPNLSSLRLALVGGHEATRREVIRELTDNYHVQDIVEVAPSSEAQISRSSIQSKIGYCDLIVVIPGYMGHDLSNIVFELQKDNALVGQVLLLACRGKSGVVREILRAVSQKVD